ncbi:hypothetical protein HMJ29_07605 [Hymenobacter taeanensis]|uniref:DUF2939 domain-containing protein n=1 Tax=Hymenobacter taeanensis TaxID=2735321 RepID=A0A6M6BFS6_9BACT|nr:MULTISPECIES: hypothetical protein [Hymenobacter]QJX46812.1 hypothetical protein HMJ29_07605 [Hymenobacter taeanensis]UOQ80682.1 DUF2939 domain-containing protein [Hymenobacter sp. 5414T-23]
MKRIILLLLLLSLAVGGYFYYRSLSAGPTYSLMQAAKATQTHSMTEFERYVDIKSVVGNLIDQVADQSETLDNVIPRGFAFKQTLPLLKPQLTQAVRKEIQRYIETGSIETPLNAQSMGSLNLSVLGGMVGTVAGPGSQFKGIKYTREEGEQASIGLEISQPRYDTTLVVEVKMRKRGDHWQATEIANAGALIKNVARLEKQRLVGSK